MGGTRRRRAGDGIRRSPAEGLLRAGVICAWVTIGITVPVLVLLFAVLAAVDWSIGDSVTW